MTRSWLGAAVCLGLATAAMAEDAADEFALGHQEYIASCAACHGEAADGNGPIATMFKTPVPNLTQIAKGNDGVFPVLKVIQIIDGRTGVRGHGNPMPLFGRRFGNEASDQAGTYGAEMIVRARVLDLALYLQSIQK